MIFYSVVTFVTILVLAIIAKVSYPFIKAFIYNVKVYYNFLRLLRSKDEDDEEKDYPY